MFTIIVKLLLIPLGIKQQKTMVKTKQIKPELDKIQAKYKNDKEKLNEETMKLYQKYDVNPMGGCLPLLIQLPILLGLYNVIQKPITWILGQTPVKAINGLIESGKYTASGALELLKEAVSGMKIENLGSMKSIEEVINACGKTVPEISIASKFDLVKFNLLGMDLSATPNISKPDLLWIIPILATGSAFFSNWVSQKINPTMDEQNQSMKTMTWMMPLMTAFFTFTLSAGIGVYWFISTMFSIAQMYVLTKYFEKKYSMEEIGKGKKA